MLARCGGDGRTPLTRSTGRRKNRGDQKQEARGKPTHPKPHAEACAPAYNGEKSAASGKKIHGRK